MTPEEEKEFFEHLEKEFAGVEESVTSDTIDLTSLPNEQLAVKLAELDAWLTEHRQILHPKTQEARDVHSQRNAIQIILRERGIEL